MPLLTWLLFGIEATISFFIKPPSDCGELSAIVIGTCASLLLVECVYSQKDREIRFVLFAGLLFRLLLLIWDLDFSWIQHLPNSGYDTAMFSSAAIQGMQNGNFGRGGAYARLLALIYSFFGVQRPIAQYFNLLLSYTAITLLLYTLDELHVEINTKRTAAKLLCILPNFAIINIILLRETLIVFLLTMSVACCINWEENGNWFWFVAGVLSSMVAAIFHSGALSVAVGECVFVVLYEKASESLLLNPKSIIAKAALVTLLMIVLFTAFGDRVLGKINGETIDSVVEGSEQVRGGSGYTVGIATSNNLLNFIVNTPLRMLYFIASPLPWQWRGISDVIAFFCSALLYIQTFHITFSVLKSSRKPKYKGLIILLFFIAVASAFMFGWGVKNAGTALRQREKFTTIYVLLYCLSREAKKNQMPLDSPVKVNVSYMPQHNRSPVTDS